MFLEQFQNPSVIFFSAAGSSHVSVDDSRRQHTLEHEKCLWVRFSCPLPVLSDAQYTVLRARAAQVTRQRCENAREPVNVI